MFCNPVCNKCGCIRDASGAGIHAAMVNRFSILYSPFIAKAIAVREGLQLVQRLNLGHVLLESDYSNLVSSIHGSLVLQSEDGTQVEDIRGLILQFRQVQFQHIGRE